MLKYHRITEEEKYIVSNWKYNGDYSIYNSLPYEEQKKLGIGLANTKNKNFFWYCSKSKVLRKGIRTTND